MHIQYSLLSKKIVRFTFDKVVFYFFNKFLKKNYHFKNIHLGEECYIFGNGASLREMDFSKFNDKITIGCNMLFLHKEFSNLNCKYYQIPAARFFYKYFKFYNKWQYNYLNDLFRKKILINSSVLFFTSISNIFFKVNNLYYEHNFMSCRPNSGNFDLDKNFCCMEGAMEAMIGQAVYMGFKKATLVGCDYIFYPSKSGHFYESKGGDILVSQSESKKRFLDSVKNKIDLEVMTLDRGKSDVCNYISYSDYFNTREVYRKNTEIVGSDDLTVLKQQKIYSIEE